MALGIGAVQQLQKALRDRLFQRPLVERAELGAEMALNALVRSRTAAGLRALGERAGVPPTIPAIDRRDFAHTPTPFQQDTHSTIHP